MPAVVLRADGSVELGMGHIMRCLALAQGFRERGMAATFVTRAGGPGSAFIAAEGYAVVEIFTGARWEEDAEVTRAAMRRLGAGTIVTDLCHRETLGDRPALDRYHGTLSRSAYTVCFTGGDLIDLTAHMIVSPYFRVPEPIPPRHPGRTYLFGPRYFVFRLEFAASRTRAIVPDARRILVAIGGSDPHRLTVKVLRALDTLGGPEPEVRVALGPAIPPGLRDEVSHLLPRSAAQWALLPPDTSLAEQMLWADLAVTGDGLTKYETAVTGTPSVMVAGPYSDLASNAQFVQAGTTEYAGDGQELSVEALARIFERVLGDHDLRTRMSMNGRALTDGRGVQRILDRLPVEVWA